MRGETETSKDSLSLEKSKADRERVEATKLKDMKSKVEKIIESNKTLNSFKKQFKIDITNEGLRIQIIDDQNRPMFDTGGAVMKPYTREILRAIGQTLNELPNKISLSGHTDAQRYVTGERGYSNWELSADRANASRRELVAGGLEEGKIMRVVGLADAVPFNKDSPTDPVNRRISIIVMNAKAVAAINKESQQIEAATASQIAEQLDNVRK